MADRPRKMGIKDEPGAEERFLRGVRKAVNTPPKPFTKPVKGLVKEPSTRDLIRELASNMGLGALKHLE